MSIFTNKPGTERPVTRAEPSSGAETAISIIAAGMRVIGDIESSGVVKIEGVVEGAIRGARQLLLGRQGTIHGDINVEEAVLAGAVVGSIVVSERVEIQGTSHIQGDIFTKSIVVLEGGMINGSVRMGEIDARPVDIDASERTGLALSQ